MEQLRGPRQGGRSVRSVARDKLRQVRNRFTNQHNQGSQPFVWAANADEMIGALRRGHQMLESIS